MIDGDPYQTADLDKIRAEQGRWLLAVRWRFGSDRRIRRDAEAVKDVDMPIAAEIAARDAVHDKVGGIEGLDSWLDELAANNCRDRLAAAVRSAPDTENFHSIEERLGHLGKPVMANLIEWPEDCTDEDAVELFALLELAEVLMNMDSQHPKASPAG